MSDVHLPIIPHRDAKASSKEEPVVHLRFLFRPAFLIRSRKSTSTFSAVGRVGTGMIGGVGAVGGAVGKGAVHGVGSVGKGVGSVGKGAAHGVGTVGKGVFGGIRRATGGKGHARQASIASIHGEMPPSAGTQTPDELEVEVLDSATGTSTPTQHSVSVAGSGFVSVTVESLSNLDDPGEKTLVAIRHGAKTIKETKAHRSDSGSLLFGEMTTFKTTDGVLDLSFTVL